MNDRPTDDRATESQPLQPGAADALARRFVFKIALTAILVLALVVSAVVVTNIMRRQSRIIADLRARDNGVAQPATQLLASTPASTPAVATPDTSADTREPAPRLSPVRARAVLERVLRPSRRFGYELSDADEARVTYEQLRAAPQDKWSGATLTRMALLAELLEKPVEAAGFIQRAIEAGDSAMVYYEAAARYSLDRDNPRRVVDLARAAASHTDLSGAMIVLAARAAVLGGETAIAAELLDSSPEIAGLMAADQLTRADVLLALERWDQAQTVLAQLPPLSDDTLKQRRNLLSAASRLASGDPAELLATIERIATQRPRDFDVQLWRGRAQESARQYEAARATFATTADLSPLRYEAWYRLGLLELNQRDRAAEAVAALQRAAKLAPANVDIWVKLGAAAINAGDLAGARDHLNKALARDSKRASTHFLIALSHAKEDHKDEATAALREALDLQPDLATQVQQSEAFGNLFTASELDALLNGADEASTEPPEPE